MVHLIILFFLCVGAFSQQNKILIKAGKLFDSKNAEFLEKKEILIESGRITKVSNNIKYDSNTKVIDLTKYTLLPGLIDSHTHLLFLEDIDSGMSIDEIKHVMKDGDALRVLRAANRAKTFLEAGITTVKDLGNSGQYLDVALKKAINEKTVDGPRIFSSGPILTPVGGQSTGLLKQYSSIIPEHEYRIIKSVEDAKFAVREHILYGADLIKICANNTPNPISLTVEEMKAIVEMAHRYNKKVTAHATNDQSAYEAVLAGVDGIEHGYQLTNKTLKLMAEKNVYLVPTYVGTKEYEFFLSDKKYDGNRKQIIERGMNSSRDIIKRALKQGVKIVAGSDNYINFKRPQGDAAKKVLVAYEELGMTPKQIIQAATYTSAQFIGGRYANSLGIIQENAFADIIAVEGDLEKDFESTIYNIKFVMKSGEIFINK